MHTLPGMDQLDEVLSGHLGARAVRGVVLHPVHYGLAPLLDEHLPHLPRGHAWHLRLVRSKYKPGRDLTAYYAVTTQHAPGERHLAVTWHGNGAELAPGAPRSYAPVTVLAYPSDPTMPALTRLSDGAYLASLAASLGGSPGASPGGTADAAAGPLQVRVLRYRPGHRHVLHARDPAAGPALVVKTERHGSGARAVRIAQLHGPGLARRCPGAGVARPIGVSVTDGASLWHEVAGRPLWRVLAASALHVVARVGGALRVLHDSDQSHASANAGDDGAGLPRCRDAEEHVALTLRAGEPVRALLPAVGRTYDDLAGRLAERLDRMRDGSSALAHGDLKCDHIFVDGNRLRLIDLDRAGCGDPALDLGALMADLRWWYPDQAGAFALALRAGYGRCEAARWTRAETLATLFQLRFAARRCAVHDPEWEPKVRAGVAAALGSARERGLR